MKNSEKASAPSPKARVEHAAERIIRKHGVSGLTMRLLAKEADVALKTPYNLYGSKTGVLISLLDRATLLLLTNFNESETESAIGQLFDALYALSDFFGADEEYYRSVFWAVMTSDHPKEREAAHANIIALVAAKIQQASDEKALLSNANPSELGSRLGLNLLANLGSWAGGHLSIVDCVEHTKTVWCALLLPFTKKKTSDLIRALI